MTDQTYVPLIKAPDDDGGFSNINVITLQEQIHNLDITHVKTRQGKVWKIFHLLNKKSVPLNNSGDGPQRVNFGSVESFGVLGAPLPEAIEGAGEREAPAIDIDRIPLDEVVDEVHKLKEQGINVEVNLAPGGPAIRPGTVLAAAVEQAEVQRDAEGRTYGEHVQHIIDTRPHAAPPAAWTPVGETEDETPAADGHQDRAHAILSASGAHRWLNCTPSARLEDQLPDSTSDAAAEGTAAHELAEYKLLSLLGNAFAGPRPESKWHDEEMEAHTDDYADHVMAELAAAKEKSPGAFLAIEERLDFSHLVPDGFGTGDATIVGDGTMTLVDLKYGKGVEVNAAENPQLKLYALGALHAYGMIYQIQRVRLVIFQPRRHNISVWETSVQDLLEWADTVVKPAAKLAFAGEGELKAGEWCQFCRHAPQCSALAAQHFQVIPTTGEALEPAAPAPDTLTDDQIAQIVQHSGAIKKWLTSVEGHALKEASEGKHYPGLKLVEGRSIRRYGDEEKVAAAVQAAGHDPYERKLLGITTMTKLLGKTQFNELLGDHLVKPEGKPTLVPEDDKRPALTVATPETVFEQLDTPA